MAEEAITPTPNFNEFNTRLRENEERNKLLRERVLLLGKNLIEIKKESEEEIKEFKKENSELKKELEKQAKTNKAIIEQIDKFVKKDDMFVIERMLKDFQPLEFTRKKDVEEMITEKLNTKETKE
jgi:ElaB/YqjD/DUF883 family membrane-anchored ribosome-binding protein